VRGERYIVFRADPYTVLSRAFTRPHVPTAAVDDVLHFGFFWNAIESADFSFPGAILSVSLFVFRNWFIGSSCHERVAGQFRIWRRLEID